MSAASENVMRLHQLMAQVGPLTWHTYAPYKQFQQKLLTPTLLNQVLFEFHEGFPVVMLTFAAVNDWAHYELQQGRWPLHRPEHWSDGANLWVVDVFGLPPHTARAMRAWIRKARDAKLGEIHWRRDRHERVGRLNNKEDA